MIGIGTAIADDPLLTVRLSGFDQRPWRVVLDSQLRLPPGSRLCATAEAYRTIVFAAAQAPAEREAELRARGVEVERVGAGGDGRLDLGETLRRAGRARRDAGVQRGRPDGRLGADPGGARRRGDSADGGEAARPAGPPGAGGGRAGGARRPRALRGGERGRTTGRTR